MKYCDLVQMKSLFTKCNTILFEERNKEKKQQKKTAEDKCDDIQNNFWTDVAKKKLQEYRKWDQDKDNNPL